MPLPLPFALIDFAGPAGDLLPIRFAFGVPQEVLVARKLDEVRAVLDAAERRARDGCWCVGYVRYEAASAFDHTLTTHTPDGPLAWFSVHRSPIKFPDTARDIDHVLQWEPTIDRAQFNAANERIRLAIEAGEVYQVNYTAALGANYEGDAFDLFCALRRAQPHTNAAFIAAPEEQILSVSPELFFDWDGKTITCAPMKGTASRGLTSEDDAHNARTLQESSKERAENVMIVDLVRNDLSRIAQVGSVQVARLFELQAWPTVWQMVSEVIATTRPGTTLADVFQALFPCGSITGAPKHSAMKLIREHEASPRGVYCGAVGVIQPGGAARFNVPIRTVTLRDSNATCGVGSGITWSSRPEDEWSEWQHKSEFLEQASHPFGLIQTLRLHAGECRHLGLHLDRLEAASQHFGFAFDRSVVRHNILESARRASVSEARVRVLLNFRGCVNVDVQPLPSASKQPQSVRLADSPISAPGAFLRHKTTRREHFDRFQAQAANAFDCLLWNAKGEVTEFTRGNVVVQRPDGECVTPPLSCGLLDGVGRARALEAGQVKEDIVTVAELANARRLWFLNSLRGWIEVRLEGAPLAGSLKRPTLRLPRRASAPGSTLHENA